MASPQIVVFALFDATTQAPLTGQTPTFSSYMDETGLALTHPAITELGGGLYKFTPTLVVNHGIVYMIDGGASAAPRYQYNFIRPEDYYEDFIISVKKMFLNRWKVVGNQLLVYDDDKTTVLFTFNLFDDAGSPTMLRIFERVPTP